MIFSEIGIVTVTFDGLLLNISTDNNQFTPPLPYLKNIINTGIYIYIYIYIYIANSKTLMFAKKKCDF